MSQSPMPEDHAIPVVRHGKAEEAARFYAPCFPIRVDA